MRSATHEEPPDFLFRSGVSDDALCISALATQVFLDTYATEGIRPDVAREVTDLCSRSAFEARLDDPGTAFLVVERHKALVAFAEIGLESGCPVAGVPSSIELIRLYVQRPFHGHGIGRALMTRAEQFAQTRAMGGIWLSAWSGNAHALAFYDRLGYRIVGNVDHPIEGVNHVNRVLVSEALSPRHLV